MALWRSVSGTQLLLAGALDAAAAEGLASAVRREVQPLLLASGAPPKGREPGPAAALFAWEVWSLKGTFSRGNLC